MNFKLGLKLRKARRSSAPLIFILSLFSKWEPNTLQSCREGANDAEIKQLRHTHTHSENTCDFTHSLPREPRAALSKMPRQSAELSANCVFALRHHLRVSGEAKGEELSSRAGRRDVINSGCDFPAYSSSLTNPTPAVSCLHGG